MENKEFIIARYSSLIELWSHQNTILLQWPSIVMTTVLIVLSILIPNQLKSLLDIHFWGNNPIAIIGAGVPLVLLGLGAYTIIYLMARAKKILIVIEKEILRIEKEFELSHNSFSFLNHPTGFSGIKLVRFYLMVFLVFPITILGFLITLGIFLGSILSGLFICCHFLLFTNNVIKVYKNIKIPL